jgi:hypothetical protein
MKAYLNTVNSKRNTLIIRGTQLELETLVSLLDSTKIQEASDKLGVNFRLFGDLSMKHASIRFCAGRRGEWTEALKGTRG